MGVAHWVEQKLADPDAESDTEIKVTVRISRVDTAVLDMVAGVLKLSRTACAKGLLVSAIAEAANVMSENDPNFAGALPQVMDEAAEEEALIESIGTVQPLRVNVTDNHPAATMVVVPSGKGVR